MAQAISIRKAEWIEGPIAKTIVKKGQNEFFVVETHSAGAAAASDMGGAQAVLPIAQEIWAKGCALDGDGEPMARALGAGKGVEAAVAGACDLASGLTRSEAMP